MSLIYFHIFLISIGILFSFGLSLWELVNFGDDQRTFDLIGAIVSAVFSAGLIIYLIWFIKKKKPYMNG